MKNFKSKTLAVLLALFMVVGVFAPSMAKAAEAAKATKTNTVTLHKLLMTKDELKAWDYEKIEDGGYNATQDLRQLETIWKSVTKQEGTLKEIPGVYFVLKFAEDYKEPGKAEKSEKAGKYVKASEGNKLTPADGLVATEKIDEAVGGLTVKNVGVVFQTANLEGNFEIDEVHEKSTYVGTDGKTLTDNKAVPVKITLPLVNKDGVVADAHVYPKNTEEKPKIDKDFAGKANPDRNINEPKDTIEGHNVGDVIKYEIKTVIPAKAKYATATWSDRMTEGLTFKTGSLIVKIADKKLEKIENEGQPNQVVNYTLTETENGFDLAFTAEGLKKINDQAEETLVTITYDATLNEKAVVAIPESNDVTFHYGNNPGHGNTPVPNKPKENGELTVTKNWDKGLKAEKVEFTLYNAQTGKKVEAGDVAQVNDYEFKNPVTIEAGDSMTYTWKGLDKDIEYKVVETHNGYSVEYGKGDAGELTAKNYKDDNPEPLKPNEPKVVTGGAKFVKTNQDGTERLPGAEFVVRRLKAETTDQYEYLTGKNADRTEYNERQSAFETAVTAYNTAVEANKQNVTIGTESLTLEQAKAKIKELEDLRDKAWNATLQSMTTWTAKKDLATEEEIAAGNTENKPVAIKLISNKLGQFEIAGLAPGTYEIEEVKAPDGYALPTDTVFSFTIQDDGSQETKDISFGIKEGTQNAQQVVNKKVTIPQTGGMGTILFTVIGAGLMGSAVFAMKKKDKEEEEEDDEE